MHPVFYSARNLFAVAGLWMALSGLVSYFLFLQLDVELKDAFILFSPLLFFYFFFCLSNYYICQRLSIRQVNLLRLMVTQLIATFVTVLLWLSMSMVYVLILEKNSGEEWFPLYWDSFLQLALIGAMLYCFWILVHYIFLMAQQSERTARTDLQKKLLISQTELQAVKATVHPHFLFNSLNMIASLALSDPKKVHRICLQISEFLRYSVSYSAKKVATVGDELDHIQNYLGIERERFGSRLKTCFDVDEDIRSEAMLPLLLFPLVENSIKHGIDSSLAGGVLKISVKKNEDVLRVHIENPYDELGRKQYGANIGLESVKKRVRAHYGDSAEVIISREPEKFVVDLNLPIVESAHEL